ncbi:MAG: glycosyltransferase [Dysgonamonadaceae bacterium]|jgi:glycosyltransferase involved in cell wall biosynthesis|nr:glycosyltransferase [Dysgonamonadaceae bacterium]
MQIPEISIVVPVYNAEKYLPDCLDSIINQTFTDFELLLVDDGSTDSSNAICLEYAQKDFRIQILTQKNGGASSARNFGINKAQGKWITFIDSDDWVTGDFLEQMLNTASELNADAVFCNCFLVKDKKIAQNLIYTENKTETSAEILKQFLLISGIRSELWGKIFKRNFLISLQLNEDLKIGEDMLYLIELYYYQQLKTVILKEPFYYYRQLKTSVMRTNDLTHHIKKLIIAYLQLIQIHPDIAEKNPVEHATFIVRSITFLTKKEVMKQFKDPFIMKLLKDNFETASVNLEPNEKRFIRFLYIHPVIAKIGFELNRLKNCLKHNNNNNENQ